MFNRRIEARLLKQSLEELEQRIFEERYYMCSSHEHATRLERIMLRLGTELYWLSCQRVRQML